MDRKEKYYLNAEGISMGVLSSAVLSNTKQRRQRRE